VLPVIEGRVPDLIALPAGCRFQARCPNRIERCELHPPLEEVAPQHLLRCFNPTVFHG
jgi:oligopeptide/dipeptide ABC transporter ATP-binding protein